MAFNDEVNRGIQQWVAWADKRGWCLSRECNQVLLKRNSFVAQNDGFTPANLTVAAPNYRRNIFDFVAIRFPLVDCAPQVEKSLLKERGDEVRLQPACIRPFHFGPNFVDARDIHRV